MTPRGDLGVDSPDIETTDNHNERSCRDVPGLAGC
jgi:hypothetical protein